ncbi:PAS domain-containing protein [Shewanella sp. AS16]|uniref:PDC sensor domain-containing protein n=1 Tax=Shewanella sp. AS16 TaxID=2907625 RepID=UPI001F211343|nr:PAS domain-containing protein [Shewanella sp. AS16]MCE9687468.1 PAS domain-containing protein [Shewanella sp. AS16]
MVQGITTGARSQLAHWRNSLTFKFSVIQFVIATILITCTVWVMVIIQRSQLLDQQTALNQSNGQLVVARLMEMTAKVETKVVAIADLGALYRHDHEQLLHSLPAIMEQSHPQSIIAGGGIWPEPGAFEQKKYRDSLFWGRDSRGELLRVDDYNSDSRKSYHSEDWYQPTRLLPAGKTLWSKSYRDPFTHQTMVTASTPLWVEHHFIGAATVDVSLTQFSAMLRNLMLDLSGYVIALDPQDRILAYPDEDKISESDPNGDRRFITFAQLSARQTEYEAVQQAVISANQAFMRSAAKASNPAGQGGQLSPQLDPTQRAMLGAIVNTRGDSELQAPKLLQSVELKHDPLLGEPALVSLFLMPNTYWKVIIVTPISSLANKANLIAAKVGAYLIAMQLLALVLLFLLQQRLFVTPMSRMAGALQQNNPALLELDASSRQDEVGMLARAFIARTRQLEVTMSSLDANNLALEQQLQSQKEAQQELKQYKDQLNALLKSSNNLIYIKDLNGRYILANDKFCETLGIEKRHILGATDNDLFPLALAQIYRKNDNRVLESNDAISFEEAFPSPHGDLSYLVTKFSILDDNDKTVAVGAIAFNIATKKQLEQQQAQAYQQLLGEKQQQQNQLQQLSHKYQTLAAQHRELGASLERQIQLNKSGHLSHRLLQGLVESLVAGMMQEQDSLLAKICRLDPESPQTHEPLMALMSQHTDRIRHLHQLVAAQHSDVKPVHLAQFIQHLLSLLQPQLHKQRVEIELECDNKLVVEGDAWSYLHLLYPLLINTLAHAFSEHIEHKRIRLKLYTEHRQLHIDCEDNGIGLTFQQLAQLKEWMRQDKCHGTLSCLSLWLRTELKGSLNIQSSINKGTKLSCCLPLPSSNVSENPTESKAN